MKIKKHLLAASIALVVSIPAKSFATIIAGIEIPGGGFLDIGTIYEGSKASDGTAPILAVGDELVGVGKVDAIKTAGGTTVWSDGDNGRELLLYFDGYKTQAINPLGAPTLSISCSPGAPLIFTREQLVDLRQQAVLQPILRLSQLAVRSGWTPLVVPPAHALPQMHVPTV